MSILTITRRTLLIAAFALTTACGFHLRGIESLPFTSIAIQGSAPSIINLLKESLTVNGVKVVNGAEQAELLVELMGESSEKRILSLGGNGLVQEYELFYRVNFRAREATNELWGPVQTLERRRDFSYSDKDVLAKQLEEVQINADMRNDTVRELMRRLAAQKSTKTPPTP
jgi:LPS-assembly lipoprotein